MQTRLLCTSRRALLTTIYAQLSKYPKDSPQYFSLLRSGCLWEQHYKPFRITERDLQFQLESKYLIKDLESFRSAEPVDSGAFRRLFPATAHQVITTEIANSVTLGETENMYQAMHQSGFMHLVKQARHVDDVEFPSPHELISTTADAARAAEMRNQLIAMDISASDQSHDPSEERIKELHRVILRGTAAEKVNTWGRHQRAGEYRHLPVQARGYPHTVYPYPPEIPALMRRFIEWRDRESESLHVVLMGCKLLSAFLHIHPFHDGNGRVGRLLLGSYLLRRGYPPPLFQNFERERYLKLLFQSQHGRPEDLYEWMLENCRDFLASRQ